MEEVSVRKRRVRYRGTHPRRFEEKYKELNPEKYSEDVQKVMARGQTPAGMHRPICVDEIMDILDPKPGFIALDATLGYGGHAQETLSRIVPGGRLFGIDVDPIELPRTEARLRDLGFGEDVLTLKRMNFAGVPQLLTLVPSGFDIILADLGVSSMQIDNPARGFTFKADGPLDLRLNPQRGRSVAEFLKEVSQDELAEVLVNNSDEPYAARISHALCSKRGEISTTKQLAEAIQGALGKNIRKEDVRKSLQRTFQALRIAVNNEFEVLDQFLDLLPACLKSSGKVAILTFHSGEDRRVKKAFKEGLADGVYRAIASEPITP